MTKSAKNTAVGVSLALASIGCIAAPAWATLYFLGELYCPTRFPPPRRVAPHIPLVLDKDRPVDRGDFTNILMAAVSLSLTTVMAALVSVGAFRCSLARRKAKSQEQA